MPKYKITIKETLIHDAIVEADSLEEAKEKAWDEPQEWIQDHEAWHMEHGQDHYIKRQDEDGEEVWEEA
jgi:hypothetical protein